MSDIQCTRASCRLLLLACSQRKRHTVVPRAAIQVYDGPAHRSLRRAIASSRVPRDVLVRIVSAKFGLLALDDQILPYDKMLDLRTDTRLISRVTGALTRVSRAFRISEVFVAMSRDYCHVLPPAWS